VGSTAAPPGVPERAIRKKSGYGQPSAVVRQAVGIPVPQWDFAVVPRLEDVFFPMKGAFAQSRQPETGLAAFLPPSINRDGGWNR